MVFCIFPCKSRSQPRLLEGNFVHSFEASALRKKRGKLCYLAVVLSWRGRLAAVEPWDLQRIFSLSLSPSLSLSLSLQVSVSLSFCLSLPLSLPLSLSLSPSLSFCLSLPLSLSLSVSLSFLSVSLSLPLSLSFCLSLFLSLPLSPSLSLSLFPLYYFIIYISRLRGKEKINRRRDYNCCIILLLQCLISAGKSTISIDLYCT